MDALGCLMVKYETAPLNGQSFVRLGMMTLFIVKWKSREKVLSW